MQLNHLTVLAQGHIIWRHYSVLLLVHYDYYYYYALEQPTEYNNKPQTPTTDNLRIKICVPRKSSKSAS